MALENVPTDVLSDELVNLFMRATTRLELIIEAGIRRGLDPARVGTHNQKRGDMTVLYRQRQREQAIAILRDLRDRSREHSNRAIATTYRATVTAVDATVGPDLNLARGFGIIHLRAVEALASNMTRSLHAAIETVGGNIDDVFARADAIESALRFDRPSPGPIPFIGRRINDPYRRVALETVAQGLVGLDTRGQVSAALVRNLIREGVTDAVTGFVDRAGRRWPLDVYAEMVARTTTREATTRATVNRLREGGLALVTVSHHEHKADECSKYDGKTFAMTAAAAAAENVPRLTELPPFHPRCRHVLTPAAGNLDAFERELGLASRAQLA